MGGLGNQMFQVACGIAMSRRSRTNILLNISHYYIHQGNTTTPREYEIPLFPNCIYLATSCFNNFWDRCQQWDRGVASIFSRLLYSYNKRFPYYISESNPRMRSFVLNPKHGSYFLSGYWQDEKYFRDNSSEIRHLFQFPAFDCLFIVFRRPILP